MARRKSLKKEFEDIIYLLKLLGILILLMIVIWLYFFVKGVVEWVMENWILVGFLLIVVIAVIIASWILYRKYIHGDDVLRKIETSKFTISKRGEIKESKEPIKSQKVDSIKAKIEEFEPLSIENEKDLEKQLYQWLRGDFDVDDQYSTQKGSIDLVVDGKIGIEIKIAETRNILRTLSGQIEDYKNYFKDIIVVLYDMGKLPDIKDYTDKYKEKGARVVVLKGPLKKKKRPYMEQKFWRR